MISNFYFESYQIDIRFLSSGFESIKKMVNDISYKDFSVIAEVENQIILRSQYGNSQAVVEKNNLKLVTFFSNGWEKPEEWEKRNTYFLKKLNILAGCLEDTSINFAGTTVISKWPVTEEPVLVKNKFSGMILHQKSVAPDHEIFDFSVRTSHVIENGYLNINHDWYQQRMIKQFIRSNTFSFNDWEGELTEEGIMLKIDFNNKKALFEKDTNWNIDKLESFTKKGLTETQNHYVTLFKLIGDC